MKIDQNENLKQTVKLPKEMPDLTSEIVRHVSTGEAAQSVMQQLRHGYAPLAGCEMSTANSYIALKSHVRSKLTRKLIGLEISVSVDEQGEPSVDFEIISCGRGKVFVACGAVGSIPYPSFTDVKIDQETSDGFLRDDIEEVCRAAMKSWGKGRYTFSEPIGIVVDRFAKYGVPVEITEPGMI